MKLYSTSDTAGSIRKAFAGFTHVLVNRGYTTIKPAYFKSASIADLPVYVWAWWDRASDGQLARWKENGGVLLDRYTYITVTNGPMDKQRDSILEPFALSAAQLPNCVSNSLCCGPPVVGHIGPQLSAHRRKRHRTALVRR